MKARLTRLWIGVALLRATAGSVFAEAADANWRPVFQDQFERTELSGDWDVYWGAARIVEGRMYLGGSPAVVILNRSFPSDVQLEFEAEVDPKLPPCDVACGLAGNHWVGYGYLLQFGARNNQCNQLMTLLKGRSKPGLLQLVRNPPFRIEHGTTYRCVATKEGNRLTYHVNGVKLLEATDADGLGGPPLDRVCVVTWSGMYVDNVRVTVRASPAPGGAVFIENPQALDVGYRWSERVLRWAGGQSLPKIIRRGVEAYNERRYQEAYTLFAGVNPPTRESVSGLAYVVGDPAFQDKEAQRETIARLARALAEQTPDDPGATAFARLADWFRQVTLVSRDKQNSERIHAVGPAHNPFYYKNELFRARFQLAIAQESGYGRNHRQAMELFAALKRLWPDHPGIAQLTGEKIPWSRELVRAASDGPPWARHLQEGLARSHAVLNWWFTARQARDGSLGGGWGDDVELLRSWGMPACITTAGETAIAGIQRLADGVWTNELKELDEDLDEGQFGDIEHGAEPAADTQPLMLLSSSVERLRVLVYSFNDTTTRIGVRPWLLVAGTYLLSQGEQPGSEARPIYWNKPATVGHRHRGTPIFADVPARKQWVIDRRLQEKLDQPALLPDLAVAGRDLRVSGDDLLVTLHNIGAAASGPFEVALEIAEGERWREAARIQVAGLPGIKDLSAVRRDVTFRGAAVGLGRRYRVVVDPQRRVEDGCEMNNAVTVQR